MDSSDWFSGSSLDFGGGSKTDALVDPSALGLSSNNFYSPSSFGSELSAPDSYGLGINSHDFMPLSWDSTPSSDFMGANSTSLYTPEFMPYTPPSEDYKAPTGSVANKGLSALKSLGSGAWDTIKANPLMALSLGMAGYNALKGPQTPPAVGDLRKSTGQTLDYMKGRTAGVDKLTQGLTDKYSSGKIDPVDERRIAQWTMAQKAQIENYYTKAGMPDSTAKINALKDIDTQALALTDQARQGYLQEAFKGMTLQAQATGQIASLQQSMNQTIAQLQQSGDVQAAQALQNLMYQTGLFAAQTRGTTQQTTTLPTV